MLDLGDTGRQDAGNLCGDPVLQRKEIGDRLVEPRGPEDLAVGFDELRTHPHAVASTQDAAFDLVAHAEAAGDVIRARGLVFVWGNCVPGHHRERRKSAQRVDHVLRQSVGEVVAGLIVALIDERENGDGRACVCPGRFRHLTGRRWAAGQLPIRAMQ